jgi:hypothetical protein
MASKIAGVDAPVPGKLTVIQLDHRTFCEAGPKTPPVLTRQSLISARGGGPAGPWRLL